jgi:hypothetical protein
MYAGYQPRDDDETYGGSQSGHADYSYNGHNEFPALPGTSTPAINVIPISGPQPPRLSPARRGMRDVQQDRAKALEAERAELTKAMWLMAGYIGFRAVAIELVAAFQPVVEP